MFIIDSEVLIERKPLGAKNVYITEILFFALASLTATCYALAATGETATAIQTMAVFYVAGFFVLYVFRKNFFGFFLLLNFSYGLLFGIPSVAWVLTNPLNIFSKNIFILGVLSIGNLLTWLSYRESFQNLKDNKRFSFEPNKAFVAVLAVIVAAQTYKLRAYFDVLSSSQYGHLAIWIDGDALLSVVPPWIRVLSGGSMLIGIIGVALFRKHLFLQVICALLITSDMVIGIRNKGFFGILAAIYIFSLFDKEKASRLFHRLSSPLILMTAFLALSLVSYFREGFEIPLADYLFIVLDSLASIVNGLLEIVSHQNCLNAIDSSLVVQQFWTLLGVSRGTQLSGEFNYCLTGDPNPLTSVSSSLIFEAFLLNGSLWPVATGLYLWVLYAALRFLERRKTIFSLSILCALAPAFLYTLRAELLQPLVFLLKSLPYLILIGLLVKRVSIQRARTDYANSNI